MGRYGLQPVHPTPPRPVGRGFNPDNIHPPKKENSKHDLTPHLYGGSRCLQAPEYQPPYALALATGLHTPHPAPLAESFVKGHDFQSCRIAHPKEEFRTRLLPRAYYLIILFPYLRVTPCFIKKIIRQIVKYAYLRIKCSLIFRCCIS